MYSISTHTHAHTLFLTTIFYTDCNRYIHLNHDEDITFSSPDYHAISSSPQPSPHSIPYSSTPRHRDNVKRVDCQYTLTTDNQEDLIIMRIQYLLLTTEPMCKQHSLQVLLGSGFGK